MRAGRPLLLFFFNDTATTEIYTLSLHDALPISEVRAGVLKLYATIPDMIVGKTDVDGQAALTLTAPPAILGGGADVLVINAGNALPIRAEITSAESSKRYVVNYKSSRVTLADVAAGKI